MVLGSWDPLVKLHFLLGLEGDTVKNDTKGLVDGFSFCQDVVVPYSFLSEWLDCGRYKLSQTMSHQMSKNPFWESYTQDE